MTKNGYGRLVVMDIDYFEETMRSVHEAQALIAGLKDLKAGRVVDGNRAFDEIREKYGL